MRPSTERAGFAAGLLALAAFAGARAPAAEAPARLRLRLLNENGRPVAARLQLFDGQGQAQPVRSATPLTAIHPRVAALGAVAPGQCEIELPARPVRLRIERGPEYRPVEIDLQAPPRAVLDRTVRLKRWIHMAARGWWSGDLHVHRAPGDMSALMEASDLNLAPTITRWNDNSSLDSWPERTVFSAGPQRAYSIDNCEDERGWGAALFFALKSPLKLYSLKTQREYPPPLPIWREAREKGGMIDLEKAIWWGAPVIAALSPPDTIGVAVNHFLERGLLDTEAWGRPRDRDKYAGARGFAQYLFDLYYRYLNCGRRIPASAGSANGVIHNPIGYNRSYVYLGRRFAFEDWLAGQKAGRNFVTNGPMLFLKVNGRLPGAVLEEAGEVMVELEAHAAGELEVAELIAGGSVAAAVRPGGDPRRLSVSRRLRVRPGSWLAARCFERCPFTVRFAHTSPVYFGRTPARQSEALAQMRAWIEAEMDRIRRLDSVTEAQREELLALCRQARDAYR